MKLPMVEAQTKRRLLKTRLPVDALVFSPRAKYICIGRDAVWSMYNHHVKANATKSVPLGGPFWGAGGQVFINKGVNGPWHEALTAADVAAYEARAVKELGSECARWVSGNGGLPMQSQ